MPIGALGATLISQGMSGLTGLYNSWRDRVQSEKNIKLSNQFNIAQAERSNQMNIENWNMQNMYNTPEAQMERYKKAGLNPLLIYGQGNPGNASGLPPYQAVKADYSVTPVHLPQMDFLNQYFDLKMKQSQLDTQEEIRKNLAVKTLTEGIRKPLLENELDIKRQESSMLMPYLTERNRRATNTTEAVRLSNLLKEVERNQRMFNLSSDKKYRNKERIATIKHLNTQILRDQNRYEFEKFGVGLPGNTIFNVLLGNAINDNTMMIDEAMKRFEEMMLKGIQKINPFNW